MWIELCPFQEKALSQMHDGCILNGGVGSGKSLTSLAYYYTQFAGPINPEKFVKPKHAPDLYIITTAKKRDSLDWEGEMTRFLLFPYDEDRMSKWGNKVYVDSWNNISKYEGVRDGFFIFDEQRVVGNGAWVKSFYRITRWNRWILLSATPGDTWLDYIPVFVANGFYRNRTDFISQHVIYRPFTSFPQVDKYISIERLERLRSRVLVEMQRDRVIPHVETVVPVEYDRQLYKEVLRNRWDPWKNEPIQNAGGLCLCLRKVVNSDERRQVALLEILEEHERAIIFYSFDYELEILREIGYPEGTVIGEWNGHRHEDIPSSPRWVYLVQYTAGAEGWNCTSTDTVVFYSLQYSYKVSEQARGRIDRLTSPYESLHYYTLKSTSSIDLAISRALATKRDFNAGRFGGRYFA